MSSHRKLFLSAVSSEFESYRKLLANDLKRPTLDVHVQEDFGVGGGSTLQKLDDYIKVCHGVVHLIGKATGSAPEPIAVKALLIQYPDFAEKLPALATQLQQPDPGFSYTQWEAYLAIFHNREIFIYLPKDFDDPACSCPREDRFVHDAAQEKSQQEHYRRICDLGRDRGQFLNPERLSSTVLRDLVEILPRLEDRIDVPSTRLRHTAERLIGRDAELTMLDEAWESRMGIPARLSDTERTTGRDAHPTNSNTNVIIVRGKGGEGKTSLVATWMAELALKDWRGAECVFDWSFYSQGTKDQGTASAETCIINALTFFGDANPYQGWPEERGARLAQLVGSRRSLLVLDGLEPLQYPPGPMHGQLTDKGMAALLRGLAGRNAGLCVVTTREKVDEIKQHYGKSATDHVLEFLSPVAGAALLHYSGARRAGNQPITADAAPDHNELQQASVEVHGHALTLFLVGQYLKLTEDGDVRRRDHMHLADADKEYTNDATRPYGHAFKAIEAYEKWFAAGDTQAQRQLAILRLLGLFDRPASKGCLNALRAEPVIPGLTDTLAGGADKDFKIALSRLEEINLISVKDDGSVDCHPLIREYFAVRLKSSRHSLSDETQSSTRQTYVRSEGPANADDAGLHHSESDVYFAFQLAHRRLYKHLCETTKEGDQPTLEALQPLYQAIAHGCQAGMSMDALHQVGWLRIQRGAEYYSTKRLGAFGSDLGAIACVFEVQWSRISSSLSITDQAWLFNAASICLSGLGRLNEAIGAVRIALNMRIELALWDQAAQSSRNLSELELTLGEVTAAVEDAAMSVKYADRSSNAFERMMDLALFADALHEAGRRAESEIRFREAEQMQAQHQPDYPLLYGLASFRYCDLLLAPAERAAWQHLTASGGRQPAGTTTTNVDVGQLPVGSRPPLAEELTAVCRAVTVRVTQTLKWELGMRGAPLLDFALNHLTLGRAELYEAMFGESEISSAEPEIQNAISGLRLAGDATHLPLGLLMRAAFRFLTAARTGPDSAESDLNEAWDIAERGGMRLFMADVLLHRARLFGSMKDEGGGMKYPWESAATDLASAEQLINACGYHRRDEELADAKAALKVLSAGKDIP